MISKSSLLKTCTVSILSYSRTTTGLRIWSPDLVLLLSSFQLLGMPLYFLSHHLFVYSHANTSDSIHLTRLLSKLNQTLFIKLLGIEEVTIKSQEDPHIQNARISQIHLLFQKSMMSTKVSAGKKKKQKPFCCNSDMHSLEVSITKQINVCFTVGCGSSEMKSIKLF